MKSGSIVYKSNSFLYSINKFLAYILLFFALFDTARNYTPLPVSFGYIKDVCVYLLFFINIGKMRIPKILGYSGLLWMTLVILFSPIGFFSATISAVTIFLHWFKFLEFFLLIIIFSNFRNIFHFGIDEYLQMYIKGCILLCFVNVFGYYVDNPIVSARMPNANVKQEYIQYQGRVTVGQSPVAIFPVIISFLWLLIYARNFKERILAIVYIICIFLANSTTGLIAIIGCLAIIILYKTYYLFFQRDRTFNVRQAVFSLLLFVLLLVLFVFLKDKVQDFLSVWETFLTRFTGFFGTKDGSMNLRRSRVADALKEFNAFQFITGMGLYGYTSRIGVAIENSYMRCILEYGIIGLTAMVTFFLRFLIYSLRDLFSGKASYQRDSLFLLCMVVVYMMHLYTLDLFILYPLYFSLALVLNYCDLQRTQQRNRLRAMENGVPNAIHLPVN